MKLTNRQETEKLCLEWFCRGFSWFKKYPPQDGEFEDYLAHSERGEELVGRDRDWDNYNIWAQCKRWRGITVHELWEDSFYSGGWCGFYELLSEKDGTPIPVYVKDFISREIFGGQEKETIDRIYAEIVKASRK